MKLQNPEDCVVKAIDDIASLNRESSMEGMNSDELSNEGYGFGATGSSSSSSSSSSISKNELELGFLAKARLGSARLQP
ncbi:hypothetical protein M569_07075 [Genlisea aurea]|uniref:Uncharacterized protein n=1 Tax=Genlisea aurea TaxID=192259 RepID=S8CKH9_9LAMI|nr:hypothetical protein M569_07075 [Genlisea aurea]